MCYDGGEVWKLREVESDTIVIFKAVLDVMHFEMERSKCFDKKLFCFET